MLFLIFVHYLYDFLIPHLDWMRHYGVHLEELENVIRIHALRTKMKWIQNFPRYFQTHITHQCFFPVKSFLLE